MLIRTFRGRIRFGRRVECAMVELYSWEVDTGLVFLRIRGHTDCYGMIM